MRRIPRTYKIETWIVKIYVQCWKFHTQLVYVYFNWFRRNSLLHCVSQPEIAKKFIKPPILAFKIIEFGANRESVYDFLLVINSNLGLISHRYWDAAIYWPKIANFAHPLSFSVLVRGDPLRIYGKALRFLKLESSRQPMVRRRFGDSSLDRFCLIHPCDRRTELRWLRRAESVKNDLSPFTAQSIPEWLV